LAEEAVWSLLADCLNTKLAAVLLVVVDSAGSSPGKPGMKLVLAADGRSAGSIGGGAVEGRSLEAARQILREPEAHPRLLRWQHDPSADDAFSGLICGGSQTVALVSCKAGDLPAVLALIDARKNHRPGTLRLSALGLAFELTEEEVGRSFTEAGEAGWNYQEGVGCSPQAYLIGGGHVSLALSPILVMLDFHVTVLEEREAVATFIANHHAHEKRRVEYAAIGHEIQASEANQAYAVVMTHAHTLDETVLRQLLDKKLRYLGLLGSQRKVAAIMASLRPDFPEHRLAQVSAPAGLPIGSHTPAEIAVSIAAEMIAVRGMPPKAALGEP